ncbi:MAG: hypothetical protein AABX59_00930 [Nanoarchaeota archaeon]
MAITGMQTAGEEIVIYTINSVGLFALVALILAVLYIMVNLMKEIRKWRQRAGIKELRQERHAAFALTIWRAIFAVILVSLLLSVVIGTLPVFDLIPSESLAAVKAWMTAVIVVGIVPPVIAELLIPERIELWKRILLVLLFFALSLIVSIAISANIVLPKI